MSEAPSLQSPPGTSIMEDPPPSLDNPDMEDLSTLHTRLAHLEQDNISLRATCSQLQHKLDMVQENSAVVVPDISGIQESSNPGNKCSNCDLLSKELSSSREDCQELKRLQQALEGQVEALQVQLEEYQVQEDKLRVGVKALEEEITRSTDVRHEVQPMTQVDPQAFPDLPPVTIEVHQESDTQTPFVTAVSQQEPLSDSLDNSAEPQEILIQCRQKLEELEKENNALKEQCRLSEIEKTTLRTNIRKISEAEDRLKQKVESLSQREQEYESLQEELEKLQEKFEERGSLLHVATDRVKQLESALQNGEVSAQDSASQLRQANNQVRELQSVHEGLNLEYRELKEEMMSLTQQVADLRFQVSSKDIERHAAVQADQMKLEALTSATNQISQLEQQISQLEQQMASERQELLSQQDKLSGEVNQLTQTAEEREGRCNNLIQQLQQSVSNLESTQLSLSQSQEELISSKKEAGQLSEDNDQLREKIIQLLRRRVRVCDDCFSVQAELAAIVASPPPLSTTTTHHADIESGSREGVSLTTSTSGPLPIACGPPDDDEYAVISDDELQSSRLSSSPSSSSPPTSSDLTDSRATLDLLTPHALTTHPPTNEEVWVGAGTRVLVPVELPTGVSLHWNFVSEPKSVSFAVLHQPPTEVFSQEEGGEESMSGTSQQRVLIPTTRVASAQGSTIRGRLLAKQPGVYTLVFDNTASRFTAKKVTYSLSLVNQEIPGSLTLVEPKPSSSTTSADPSPSSPATSANPSPSSPAS